MFLRRIFEMIALSMSSTTARSGRPQGVVESLEISTNKLKRIWSSLLVNLYFLIY